MLVLYLGKRIGLGYNNKLMKCCVNIIYTIVIFDSTCVMKIMKGVTIIVHLCTMMIITEEQSVVIMVRVSLGAPFIWPCATSKQKA